MLAHVEQEPDQFGVPGVEAHPHAGQVGALGQRVDRHHAVDAGGEHGRRRAVPGELGVALVGEHRDAVARPQPRPPPRSLSRPVGFDGELTHSSRARSTSDSAIEARSSPPLRAAPAPAPAGSRPAAPPWRRSDRTPPDRGRCPAPAVRRRRYCGRRRHELLGPDAGGQLRRRDRRRPRTAASSQSAAAWRRPGDPAEGG